MDDEMFTAQLNRPNNILKLELLPKPGVELKRC